MSDALIVWGKELRELVGAQRQLRGSLIQPLIMAAVLGIMMPLSAPGMWLAGNPGAIVYYLLFPGIVSAVVAADAFAGERERKTLETLLATPLSDQAIVLGKTLAALTIGVVTALVAFELGTLTINVSQHPAHPFLPGSMLWAGALGAALSGALCTTAATIFVSMKVVVARTAQQIASIMSLVIAGVLTAIWSHFHLPFDWRHVFYAEAAVAALGVVLLTTAVLSFNRDSLLERR